MFLSKELVMRNPIHRPAEIGKIVPAYFGEQMRKALSTLPPREEMLLRMRFGIGRRAGQFDDLPRQFSFTRKRIRQMEVEAVRKLREKTRCFYSELHHE
jgi:DNA-directed RNA polymerase sigma subunit (sigma70/sigma32)